jgi:hypothetical protein
VVVPFAGKGGHDPLRARLLGSLGRERQRAVSFIRVVPPDVVDDKRAAMRTELLSFAAEETHGVPDAEVITADDAVAAIADYARPDDLLVLGLQRTKRRRVVSATALEIAKRTKASVLMISHRR